MFDKNFGNCEPILKILWPIDSRENSLRIHRKDFHNILWKTKIEKNVTDFDSILNKLLICSWGHFGHLI